MVGNTYPGWYDPANPAQAVFRDQFDWIVFIVPGTSFLMGGVFVVGGIVLVIKTRNEINA